MAPKFGTSARNCWYRVSPVFASGVRFSSHCAYARAGSSQAVPSFARCSISSAMRVRRSLLRSARPTPSWCSRAVSSTRMFNSSAARFLSSSVRSSGALSKRTLSMVTPCFCACSLTSRRKTIQSSTVWVLPVALNPYEDRSSTAWNWYTAPSSGDAAWCLPNPSQMSSCPGLVASPEIGVDPTGACFACAIALSMRESMISPTLLGTFSMPTPLTALRNLLSPSAPSPMRAAQSSASSDADATDALSSAALATAGGRERPTGAEKVRSA